MRLAARAGSQQATNVTAQKKPVLSARVQRSVAVIPKTKCASSREEAPVAARPVMAAVAGA